MMNVRGGERRTLGGGWLMSGVVNVGVVNVARSFFSGHYISLMKRSSEIVKNRGLEDFFFF